MSQDDPPVLRVVRGRPDDVEVAALVVALATCSVPGEGPAPRRTAWNAPARMIRRPVRVGRDGWRASSLPG